MLGNTLLNLLDRDLNRLEEEITAYETTAALWRVMPGIKNAAGNLCLHLCGNLQHFIGAVLGHTGYIRNREWEFTANNLTKEELLTILTTTRQSVHTVIAALTQDDLEKIYPETIFSKEMSTGEVIIYLCTHLNYHLGQINYHRR